MKIIRKDPAYSKEKLDVQRSVDMAVDRLHERLSSYIEDQKLEVGKIFGDDIVIHDIINKYFYVYKCRVNQMQIRILYTVRNGKLIILGHWYKNRTNNDYIKHFKQITSQYKRA